jgi:hypothetical protein
LGAPGSRTCPVSAVDTAFCFFCFHFMKSRVGCILVCRIRFAKGYGVLHMKEPLKVFFDGKFVGEVPETGDREANLKAMSALLRASGAPAPLTRPQAAFRQASAFAINAQHLFNTGLLGVPPRNPMNVIPFVVNASFAVELYFKTLGFVYGHNQHGQDLLELFDELPVEAKELLRREIATSPPTQGIKDLTGFRTEIERVRHVFHEWRYLHERNRASEIRFPELIHILNVLHNTCRADARLKPSPAGAAAGVAATVASSPSGN